MTDRLRLLEAVVETQAVKVKQLGKDLQASRCATRDKFMLAVLPHYLTTHDRLTAVRAAYEVADIAMQVRAE